MLTGILIGLVAGVGLSAAVAVWVARMPSPFQNRALDTAGGPPAAVGGLALPAATNNPPAVAAGGAVAGGGTAPNAAGASSGSSPADPGAGSAARAAGNAGTAANGQGGSAQGTGPATTETPPSGDAGSRLSTGSTGKTLESGTALVQVGAFANEDDALRQVETIAQVTGARARILPPEHADHPLYRVRIGPVARGQELTELVDALKANGITSTVVRVPTGDTAR